MDEIQAELNRLGEAMMKEKAKQRCWKIFFVVATVVYVICWVWVLKEITG